MKLHPKQSVVIGKRTYTGEIPDNVIPEGMEKQLKDKAAKLAKDEKEAKTEAEKPAEKAPQNTDKKGKK